MKEFLNANFAELPIHQLYIFWVQVQYAIEINEMNENPIERADWFDRLSEVENGLRDEIMSQCSGSERVGQ